MKSQFLATGAINIEEWRAGKARVTFKQAQRLPILAEGRAKSRGLFPGESDHAHFRDHDRPTKDRTDGESRRTILPATVECSKAKRSPPLAMHFDNRIGDKLN